ncbi:MAG: 4Fe-4S binding protein [Coriobacteriia bacterium]|jgi:Pyruvate/2-oxoacid:ferredoxin oxidoreductase delta subunit|nr:4Fe-4S binding protein [Coriobacteriia bacterium]
MCQFCVQHGDGEKWYLQASNYAADLERDLERRGYIVSFIGGFEENRRKIRAGLSALRFVPKPLADPVRKRVSEHMQVDHFGQPVPIEECEKIISMATSVVRIPCLCRGQRKAEDGVCLVVTVRPVDDVLAEGWSSFADGPDVSEFERLDREGTLALLRRCEHDGLAHTVWTFKTPFVAAICNCDISSGCLAMNLTLKHDIKVMWKGEWVARLNSEACTSCGACVRACPFSAISRPHKDAPVSIAEHGCWGCGTCRSSCPQHAISLVDRRSVPALTAEW